MNLELDRCLLFHNRYDYLLIRTLKSQAHRKVFCFNNRRPYSQKTKYVLLLSTNDIYSGVHLI